MKKKMLADMTERRHYWKMMVRLAHKDVEMFCKCEKGETIFFLEHVHVLMWSRVLCLSNLEILPYNDLDIDKYWH